MKYLLDTHAIIWYVEDSPDLPNTIANLIDDAENDIYISSVSLWEIAIKVSLGKLDLTLPLDEFFASIRQRDFTFLQIEDAYMIMLAGLPFHHRDPFDRLIVSAALVEDLTIVTVDENIKKYDAACIW